MMMVRLGKADTLLAGVGQHYPSMMRPALQLLDKKPGVNTVAALYALVFKDRTVFLADTAVNLDRNEAEDIAKVAILSADTVRKFGVEPRVAMLSFSNFGSVEHPMARKMEKATELVKKLRPDIVVDGEMQADTAVLDSIITNTYPFSTIKGTAANTLIFPDMPSANIAYKLLWHLRSRRGHRPDPDGHGQERARAAARMRRQRRGANGGLRGGGREVKIPIRQRKAACISAAFPFGMVFRISPTSWGRKGGSSFFRRAVVADPARKP